MYLSRRFAVAALLAAAVAVALPASTKISLALVNGFLVLLAAADVVLAPSAQRLSVSREAPAVISVGDEHAVTVRLRNPVSRRLRLSVRDASPPSLQRTPVRHAETAPALGWVTLLGSITATRRGLVSLGPLTVRAAGPLGLAGRQSNAALPTTIKVYPALPGRAEVELRMDRARLLQSGQRSSAYRGGGSDFDTLRDYSPDDEFRRINWSATARAAKPMTNLYREERNQHVMLLLDTSRLMAGTIDGVSRLELGLDAAFAVARIAATVGDHVGMVAFGADVVSMVPARSGRAQPKRIIDALFATEPSLDAPNYSRAFGALLGRQRRRALLVLLTEINDASAMESLFQALPSLLRHHLLIVGAVQDRSLEGAASTTPETSEAAYMKAAAAGTLLARDSAAALLRRMGVVVVDRRTGELAGALADAYLNLKGAGRL